MSDTPDKKLLSDEEWSELMSQAYDQQGSPVDAVAKARVWRSLEKKTLTSKRSRALPWAVAAAGVVATLGITQVFQMQETWRDKGVPQELSVPLSPHVLEPNGRATPVHGQRVLPGTTIVFKARATQNVVYGLIISENDQAPRLAIEDGQLTAGDPQLVMKQGSVYGETIDPDGRLKACLVASSDLESLRVKFQDLNHLMASLPVENCVSLTAGAP